MGDIAKIAIIGASGNFGTPITAALRQAGLQVTVVTRAQSETAHPPGLPVIRTDYTIEKLTEALSGQDAVICVVGPGGIAFQTIFIDAAEAAGVKRFIIDDFGWGPDVRGLPAFDAVHKQRRTGWDHAKARAEANHAFTWTGITTGNPIDWAMSKFPLMGFNVAERSAIIYDDGTEQFTGTTLQGIGQAALGIMQHPGETANRFVKVRSIQTCQSELLKAFQTATGQQWSVERSTTKELKASGESKFQSGTKGWVLELAVAQLLDKGEGRCIVAPSREASDAELLGVAEESPLDVVQKILRKV